MESDEMGGGVKKGGSGGEGRRSLNPRSVPPLVFRSLSLHIQDSFKS